MVGAYVLLGTLGIHSIEDIRDKKITVTITLFSGILGILLHLLFPDKSIFEILFGMLPGVGILLLGWLTGCKIGMGDGMMFMLTGLYLGVVQNLLLMLLSFSLAGFYGGCLFILRRCKKSDRLPFVPFLFLGYLFMLMK